MHLCPARLRAQPLGLPGCRCRSCAVPLLAACLPAIDSRLGPCSASSGLPACMTTGGAFSLKIVLCLQEFPQPVRGPVQPPAGQAPAGERPSSCRRFHPGPPPGLCAAKPLLLLLPNPPTSSTLSWAGVVESTGMLYSLTAWLVIICCIAVTPAARWHLPSTQVAAAGALHPPLQVSRPSLPPLPSGLLHSRPPHAWTPQLRLAACQAPHTRAPPGPRAGRRQSSSSPLSPCSVSWQPSSWQPREQRLLLPPLSSSRWQGRMRGQPGGRLSGADGRRLLPGLTLQNSTARQPSELQHRLQRCWSRLWGQSQLRLRRQRHQVLLRLQRSPPGRRVPSQRQTCASRGSKVRKGDRWRQQPAAMLHSWLPMHPLAWQLQLEGSSDNRGAAPVAAGAPPS